MPARDVHGRNTDKQGSFAPTRECYPRTAKGHTCPVVGIFTPCMLEASPSAKIVPLVPNARMYLPNAHGDEKTMDLTRGDRVGGAAARPQIDTVQH